MFNARIETADTSGAFKDAFASTRCLIPADGFFEWTKARPMAARTPGTSSCRATGVFVRRTVGAQQEARHYELHDHH